jgi:5-hydroxyisourate hydrolase
VARLTTHVLDLAAGHPAAGVTVDLYVLEHQGSPGASGASPTPRLLASAETGADGRPPRPLLEAASLPRGTYELVFQVGSYFRANGVALPEPAFLDRVPVRFGVGDPEGEYHVPLLVSPWGYSTYRGS